MTKIEERYEGDFLEAMDLPEGTLVNVQIESVTDPDTEKDAAGKPIKKAILAFKGKRKRMILNKVNYKVLKRLFGADPASWIGQSVQIQRRYLDASRAFGIQNEMCIRIIPPDGTPVPKAVRDFIGHKHPITAK